MTPWIRVISAYYFRPQFGFSPALFSTWKLTKTVKNVSRVMNMLLYWPAVMEIVSKEMFQNDIGRPSKNVGNFIKLESKYWRWPQRWNSMTKDKTSMTSKIMNAMRPKVPGRKYRRPKSLYTWLHNTISQFWSSCDSWKSKLGPKISGRNYRGPKSP